VNGSNDCMSAFVFTKVHWFFRCWTEKFIFFFFFFKRTNHSVRILEHKLCLFLLKILIVNFLPSVTFSFVNVKVHKSPSHFFLKSHTLSRNKMIMFLLGSFRCVRETRHRIKNIQSYYFSWCLLRICPCFSVYFFETFSHRICLHPIFLANERCSGEHRA
jgi:hypothetical protein